MLRTMGYVGREKLKPQLANHDHMAVDRAVRDAGHRVGDGIVTGWRVVDRARTQRPRGKVRKPARPLRLNVELGNTYTAKYMFKGFVMIKKDPPRPIHVTENFRPSAPPKAPQNYRPETAKPGGTGHQGNYVPPTTSEAKPSPPPMPKKK
jgi:hypothetical protein